MQAFQNEILVSLLLGERSGEDAVLPEVSAKWIVFV
jgi:hypothetical protein